MTAALPIVRYLGRMKRSLLLAGALCMGAAGVFAQNAAVAAGGEATGPGGTAAFSIGQVADITVTGSGGRISQGVQQPYDDVSTTVADPHSYGFISAYPSITADNVLVLVPAERIHDLRIDVTDAQGRILLQRAITDQRTELSLAAFATGNYHLIVHADGELLRTFTILRAHTE